MGVLLMRQSMVAVVAVAEGMVVLEVMAAMVGAEALVGASGSGLTYST